MHMACSYTYIYERLSVYSATYTYIVLYSSSLNLCSLVWLPLRGRFRRPSVLAVVLAVALAAVLAVGLAVVLAGASPCHAALALLDAAEIAGIRVLSLIEENTAAALQYGLDRTFENTTHHVLFYNMGANSVQVSVVAYSS